MSKIQYDKEILEDMTLNEIKQIAVCLCTHMKKKRTYDMGRRGEVEERDKFGV